jgi:hypothetical protein
MDNNENTKNKHAKHYGSNTEQKTQNTKQIRNTYGKYTEQIRNKYGKQTKPLKCQKATKQLKIQKT